MSALDQVGDLYLWVGTILFPGERSTQSLQSCTRDRQQSEQHGGACAFSDHWALGGRSQAVASFYHMNVAPGSHGYGHYHIS